MKDSKSVFVAIVGKPNVGKSSLMNLIIGQKIAIVSNKPQTTRNKITGILTSGSTQFVFLDTPGLYKQKNKLSKYMVGQVKESIVDVDVIMLVVEAGSKNINLAEMELIKKINELKMPAILVINKIDMLTKKEIVMETINLYYKEYKFNSVVPISVYKNDGIDILMQELDKYSVNSPHYFSDDMVTDQMEKIIVSEIIREKMLKNLDDEIPHGIAVVIEKMKERNKHDIIDIDAMIYCERENHKGIIIGKKGEKLKKIASQSRIDIEYFLNLKVNLNCWIKVRDNWRNSDIMIKNFGYKS